MPRVVDTSQMNFGQAFATTFLNALDPEALGQQVADKIAPPKLSKVANVGDRELQTDDEGSFFLDGRRQKQFPSELIGLADRERNISRQDATDKRAVQDQQMQQARFGMETFSTLMGIQRNAEDQAMQKESHEWQRAQYEHTRNAWASEQATQQKEKEAYTPINQQYVLARLQGAQKVGAQIDPKIADSLTAAAEFMPPDKFKTVADSMFSASMAGQDTSQFSADIEKGYAALLDAQGKARADVASAGVENAVADLKRITDGGALDPQQLAEATSTVRIRQQFAQVAMARSGLRWRPGLPRSLTEYDQVIGGGNQDTGMAAQYWMLATQLFQSQFGRPPSTPQDVDQITMMAQQMSSEDGWGP